MKTPIIIDTDPGHDDALAIMLTVKSDVFDIKAITTVAGNSTIENTIKKGLYRFKEIRNFEPDKKELKILTNTIFNFNKGYNKEIQIKKVRNIYNKYLDKGAEIVILGCTEFAVMLDMEDIPKINTIDILVNTTVSKLYC